MRVGLCSKEGLFGDALASLLDSQGQYQVVATETAPKALVSAAKDNRAEILIVDSYQLDLNDLQFLLGARAFGDFAVVLIVPDEEKDQFMDIAVDRIVGRGSGAGDLFGALQDLGGKVYVGRSFVRESRRGYGAGNDLTRREYEVAQLVSKGMSNRKISQITGLREQSIKNLVSVIMRKLNCENRVQVALRLTRGAAPESASAE
jgi:two-component system response regulator DegU